MLPPKNTIERASADVGFMMAAYNLMRILNIIGLKNLKQYLENIAPFTWLFMAIWKPFLSYFTTFKQEW